MHKVTISTEFVLSPFDIAAIYMGSKYGRINAWEHLEKWCEDNCTNIYEMVSYSYTMCSMDFETEEDAMAFKLRWT